MSHWYCPVCKERKEPVQVTHQETCDKCGEYVKWIESENDPITDQEIMERVQAIRDETGQYTWFSIDGDAFISDENSISYEYGIKNKDNSYTSESFSTREALVAHLDGILADLRPKEETTR